MMQGTFEEWWNSKGPTIHGAATSWRAEIKKACEDAWNHAGGCVDHAGGRVGGARGWEREYWLRVPDGEGGEYELELVLRGEPVGVRGRVKRRELFNRLQTGVSVFVGRVLRDWEDGC